MQKPQASNGRGKGSKSRGPEPGGDFNVLILRRGRRREHCGYKLLDRGGSTR